jgi:hypothetical protein
MNLVPVFIVASAFHKGKSKCAQKLANIFEMAAISSVPTKPDILFAILKPQPLLSDLGRSVRPLPEKWRDGVNVISM